MAIVEAMSLRIPYNCKILGSVENFTLLGIQTVLL